MKLHSLKFVLFGVFLCFKPAISWGIIGGSSVEPGTWIANSTVLILNTSPKEGVGICSGTLIGSDLVLTAAHCLENHSEPSKAMSASKIIIYLGNFYGEWDSSKLMSVIEYRQHPNFCGTCTRNSKLNDIAILKLKKRVQAPFTPIPILRDEKALQPGMRVLIAGYGNYYYQDHPRDQKERVLRTDIYKISSRFPTQGGMIVFNKSTTGMASGDSGGPAFRTLRSDGEGPPLLVGVASGYREKKHPSYESVPRHADWIEKMAFELDSNLLPEKFLKVVDEGQITAPSRFGF